jgi:hypothetical protein
MATSGEKVGGGDMGRKRGLGGVWGKRMNGKSCLRGEEEERGEAETLKGRVKEEGQGDKEM